MPDLKTPKPNRRFLWIAMGLMLLFTLVNLMQLNSTGALYEEISYNEFMNMVERGQVAEVVIDQARIVITPAAPVVRQGLMGQTEVVYYTGYLYNPDLMPLLLNKNIKLNAAVPTEISPLLAFFISYVLPIGIFILAIVFITRHMGKRMDGSSMSFGNSKAKVYAESDTGVTFRDVAGQDEAKDSLMEIVDFLHSPKKYTDIGAKLPKGALLVGPPGTGKTLLAKAVAGEAKVPFFSISGSQFVEMFVGVGASRVRDLFKQALDKAPCIVFIDEIDAIGKSRSDGHYGGNDEREQTLNQLLADMDGFDSSKGVVLLAATNRPEVLDKALLRPGRFDRRVIINTPDLAGRIKILEVHVRPVKLSGQVRLRDVALATSGASGADLANIVNEAALRAVRQGRSVIMQEDLLESVETVIAGQQKKDRVMTKQEREIVAYHEIGHALVSYAIKNTQPVQKITIIPRTSGALGYTMHVPEEERFLLSRDEIMAQLCFIMGGRAAEELVFHKQTTGASDDIEKATGLARKMITQYGMSKRFGMMSLESVQSRYLDGRPMQTCSDETASEIDEEIRAILAERYQHAMGVLEKYRDKLDRAAAFLLERETVTGEEFMEIVGELEPSIILLDSRDIGGHAAVNLE